MVWTKFDLRYCRDISTMKVTLSTHSTCTQGRRHGLACGEHAPCNGWCSPRRMDCVRKSVPFKVLAYPTLMAPEPEGKLNDTTYILQYNCACLWLFRILTWFYWHNLASCLAFIAYAVNVIWTVKTCSRMHQNVPFLMKQESPAVADKPARRLRKVRTVYVRAVGL